MTVHIHFNRWNRKHICRTVTWMICLLAKLKSKCIIVAESEIRNTKAKASNLPSKASNGVKIGVWENMKTCGTLIFRSTGRGQVFRSGLGRGCELLHRLPCYSTTHFVASWTPGCSGRTHWGSREADVLVPFDMRVIHVAHMGQNSALWTPIIPLLSLSNRQTSRTYPHKARPYYDQCMYSGTFRKIIWGFAFFGCWRARSSRPPSETLDLSRGDP